MDISTIPVAEDVCSTGGSTEYGKKGWPRTTGRSCDIADLDYDEDGDWNIGCHFPEPPGPHRPKFRVGPGTCGWIVRFGPTPRFM